MNLSGLVAVSGKQGLFKVIGQSKAGFILQSLEEVPSRIVVNANARLAALDETTVYGLDHDIPLKQILLQMQAEHASTPVPDPKSDGTQLRSYFSKLVPDHDSERVYSSDIKKIASWYHLLEKLPLFTEDDPKDKVEESGETPSETPSAGTSAAASTNAAEEKSVTEKAEVTKDPAGAADSEKTEKKGKKTGSEKPAAVKPADGAAKTVKEKPANDSGLKPTSNDKKASK